MKTTLLIVAWFALLLHQNHQNPLVWATSSKKAPSQISTKQVDLSGNSAASSACSRLVAGKTSVLAAGRLYDRFLLLTSDLFLFELHPDNYLDPRKAVPPYRLFTSSPPVHLSSRLPASYPAFAAEIAQNLLYGFTLSVYHDFDGEKEKVLRADYLAFVYLNTSAGNQDHKHCLFALDLANDRPVRSVCSESFASVQALSSHSMPLLLAGYVRAGEQPQQFCGPEMRQIAVFFADSSLLESPPPLNGSREDDDDLPEEMPCLLLDTCSYVDLLGEGSPELEADRAGGTPGRCASFSGGFSAGFYLSDREVAIIDGSGAVHHMEDLTARRQFVVKPLGHFIGCDLALPWNLAFKKKHIISGVLLFLVVQVMVGLFICYSLNLCGKHHQTPVKKVKKRKRSKRSKSRSSFDKFSEGVSSRNSRKSSSFSADQRSSSFSAKKSTRNSLSRGSSKMSRKSNSGGRNSVKFGSTSGAASTAVSFSKRRSSVLEGGGST